MIPTIKDVARKAGVSVASVSKVINNRPQVSVETRSRVLAAIEELGYAPNQNARELVEGQTRTVGLLLPTLENPIFAQAAKGVETAAARHGYQVILGDFDEDLTKEACLLEMLRSRRVEGTISVGFRRGNERHDVGYHALVAAGTPVVFLMGQVEEKDFYSIFVDEEEAGYLAACYLLGLGHRRLVYLAGPATAIQTRQKIKGIARAHQERHLELKPEAIVHSDYHLPGGAKAARAIYARADRPTAVFAFNDLMAIGAIKSAREMGLRVPDDISIMGFDGIDWTAYYEPALTTLRQPARQMGQAAFDLILKIIKGERPTKRRYPFHAELVEGGSTRPLTAGAPVQGEVPSPDAAQAPTHPPSPSTKL